MEYENLLESMKDADLDNFKWRDGDIISIPKYDPNKLLERDSVSLYDVVRLPNKEIGLVIEISNIVWGHPFKCIIIDASINDRGSQQEYKREEIKVINLRMCL